MATKRVLAVGYKLLVVDYKPLAVGYRLLVAGYRLQAVGYRLLVAATKQAQGQGQGHGTLHTPLLEQPLFRADLNNHPYHCRHATVDCDHRQVYLALERL